METKEPPPLSSGEAAKVNKSQFCLTVNQVVNRPLDLLNEASCHVLKQSSMLFNHRVARWCDVLGMLVYLKHDLSNGFSLLVAQVVEVKNDGINLFLEVFHFFTEGSNLR